MHTAAKNGNKYTMKGLTKLGADINIKDKDGVSETILLVIHIIEHDLGKEKNLTSESAV